MGFSEKTQAYVAGKYYEYLKKSKRENYREIFMLATKHYAMQRGSRMAQRALRDGQKLDYATFCRYGEWIPSREMLNAGEACAKVEISVEPDYEYHVTYCPWNRQFVDMGQEEAGRIYCGCLDEAILRGFNEAVKFRTVQTRYEGAECIFHIKEAGIRTGEVLEQKPENVRDFGYHTAHTYYAFREIVEAVMGEQGKEAARRVLEDFRKDWGEELTEKLAAYSTTNCNVCD